MKIETAQGAWCPQFCNKGRERRPAKEDGWNPKNTNVHAVCAMHTSYVSVRRREAGQIGPELELVMHPGV